MTSLINWRIFSILLILSILSVVAVFPYVLTLQHELLSSIPYPLSYVFAAQLIQSTILFSITIILGLIMSRKINFQLPILQAIVTKSPYIQLFKSRIKIALPLGVVVAILIYLTDIIFSYLGATISISQNLAPIWQKLLAAFYGGITEEILMRLFLMTLFIWVGTKLTRLVKPNSTIIVISIILSSIIFGMGHLPVTASLTSITPLIIYRAIVLNGIGGIVFGWLYWKKGLESAMIAHFVTDITLLTVIPLLF